MNINAAIIRLEKKLVRQQADAVSYTPAGTGAVATTVQAKMRESVSVKDFGAVGDGVTDDTNSIQEGIDYLGSIGGGFLFMPPGTYKISSTLDIKYPRVALLSTAGRNTFHDTGTEVNRVIINVAFAGTGLKIRTPYAAEQNVSPSAAYKYTGAGCLGITFTGGEVGLKALEIDSVSWIDVDVYATGFVGSIMYEIKCGVSGTDLGEPCDVQFSRIVLRGRAIDAVAEYNTSILVVNGSNNANFSLNRLPHHGLSVIAQHKNGDVMRMISGDNNDISLVGVLVSGGTGRLCAMVGPTTASPVGAEGNAFLFISGVGAITAQGTDTPGVLAGVKNKIINWDNGNGTPAPTAGTGSIWIYESDDGVTRSAAFTALGLGDSLTTARAARAALTTETVRIHNTSGYNVGLTDGTNLWAVGFDGANLRIREVVGGGTLILGNGAPVIIAGPVGFLGAAAASQIQGYGTPTGNSIVANFPGATATLAQTSASVAQLITELKKFGFFGA